MGIYLNEAGAHTKYINKKYKEYDDHIQRANMLDDASLDARRNGQKSVAYKLKHAADEHDKKSSMIANKLNNNPHVAYLYANKHKLDISPVESNNQNSIRHIKKNLGVGKDNMPKNREPGTYLDMQNRLNSSKKTSIKEACEYILDMLDEEYYDEYED